MTTEKILTYNSPAENFDEALPVGNGRIGNENDLHSVFGTVCCLAELQRALRGSIITEKPLKLVLDRRPFI